MTENEQPVAVVTGASRGLGRAAALALLQRGWRVIGDARRPGEEGWCRAGDVTDAAHRQALVEAAGSRLDLLVNNAGALGPSPLPPLARCRPADVRDVLEANVVAPLALIAAALPRLRSSRGAIVNVTSDAAMEPYPGWGVYGLSKAALEQASAVLAAEEPDVAVWWFDPGDMRTTMHQDAFPGEDISDRPLPEEVAVPALLELLTRRPPSGRVRAGDLVAP